MSNQRQRAEFKTRPHLNRRLRRAGASMNPLAVYAATHRLTLTNLAALLGVSRSYLSDAVNCRTENPATILSLFATKTGIALAKVKADYKRCRAALEEMEENRLRQEIAESDQWIQPVAPENPMRRFLNINGLTPATLARQLSNIGAAAIEAILNNKATFQQAESVFYYLAFQSGLSMAKAGIYSKATDMYRNCLAYEEKRAKIEHRYAVVNSWIEKSQPRPALAEPE